MNRVKSIYDKINDIKVLKNGEVLHNLFAKEDENGKMRPRKFKDMDKFNSWKKARIFAIKKSYREKLTPH